MKIVNKMGNPGPKITLSKLKVGDVFHFKGQPPEDSCMIVENVGGNKYYVQISSGYFKDVSSSSYRESEVKILENVELVIHA